MYSVGKVEYISLVNKSISQKVNMPTSTSKPKKSGTIITPEATAIFVFVWEPRPSMNEGGAAQFAISLLFKRAQLKEGSKNSIAALRQAVNDAAIEKFGSKAVSSLESGRLKNPFREVDDMETPIAGFKGGVFITAKSKNRPGIVDADLERIMEPMDFYPGCICRASVAPFAFDKKGSRGVTFLLNNIQKIADGDRLDGKKQAEDEFGQVNNDTDPFDD